MGKIKKVVLKLNLKKSSMYGAILASILKQSIKVPLEYKTNIINRSLKEPTFPDELKQSEVIWVYKKLTLFRRRITDQRVYYRSYQKSLIYK